MKNAKICTRFVQLKILFVIAVIYWDCFKIFGKNAMSIFQVLILLT